jgi:hypothetical protein
VCKNRDIAKPVHSLDVFGLQQAFSAEYNLSSQGKITEMQRKQVQEQMKPK